MGSLESELEQPPIWLRALMIAHDDDLPDWDEDDDLADAPHQLPALGFV
jgi:hypothetical protein